MGIRYTHKGLIVTRQASGLIRMDHVMTPTMVFHFHKQFLLN